MDRSVRQKANTFGIVKKGHLELGMWTLYMNQDFAYLLF